MPGEASLGKKQMPAALVVEPYMGDGVYHESRASVVHILKDSECENKKTEVLLS